MDNAETTPTNQEDEFAEYRKEPGYYLAVNRSNSVDRSANKLIISERRAKVAKLIHARIPQFQIAEILGVSKETVKCDAEWLREQWREEALQDVDEQLQRELEELSVWEARLSAWAMKHKNPMYVDRILKIKDARAKLLGLYRPAKVALTNPDGTKPYAAMSDDELDARIAELQEIVSSSVDTNQQDVVT